MRESTVDNTIRPALTKHILPAIGQLPLAECSHYPAMRKMVATMVEAGLSPRTVNMYFGFASSIVASFKGKSGEPKYGTKWDLDELDLPLVDTTQQRRPSIDEKVMSKLAQHSNLQARMLFVLAASSGCRIAELLGLEIKDVLDDGSTLHIVQQARGTKLDEQPQNPERGPRCRPCAASGETPPGVYFKPLRFGVRLVDRKALAEVERD